MRTASSALLLGSTLALGACASAPTPVVGLPAPGKDVATFQKEDTACRQEASQAARAPASPGEAGAANSNAQWQIFFDHYAHCETAHGNGVQPVPWAAAYADYLGTSTVPYAYVGTPYAWGYGYPYAYAGYPYYYGGPFLFGYPYPFFFGAGYGFGFGHYGYGHFGGGFHGGGGHR